MSQQSGNLNVLAGSEPIPRYLSGVSAPRMFLPQEQCWAILRKHASGADQAVFQEVAPVWDTRGEQINTKLALTFRELPHFGTLCATVANCTDHPARTLPPMCPGGSDRGDLYLIVPVKEGPAANPSDPRPLKDHIPDEFDFAAKTLKAFLLSNAGNLVMDQLQKSGRVLIFGVEESNNGDKITY